MGDIGQYRSSISTWSIVLTNDIEAGPFPTIFKELPCGVSARIFLIRRSSDD